MNLCAIVLLSIDVLFIQGYTQSMTLMKYDKLKT